jgi:hypothetical protein
VSVTAAGLGVDLSAASVAVFAELPPDSMWLRQVIRIGSLFIDVYFGYLLRNAVACGDKYYFTIPGVYCLRSYIVN